MFGNPAIRDCTVSFCFVSQVFEWLYATLLFCALEMRAYTLYMNMYIYLTPLSSNFCP